MSEGFNKWSNNPNTDPNLLAIRWGEQKPILETELNEMQDLVFQQKLRENLASRKHSTYSAVNCKLEWKTVVKNARVVSTMAQHFDLDTSSNSIDSVLYVNLYIKIIDATKSAYVTFYFGGGLEYNFKVTGNHLFYSQAFPKFRSESYDVVPISVDSSATLKAKLKHFSPDEADANYDDSVNFAYDSRAGKTTTQRVKVVLDDEGISLSNDNLDTVMSRLNAQRITSFNDETNLNDTDKIVECLLATWKLHYTNEEHFELVKIEPKYTVQQVSTYLPTKALNILPDFDKVVGTYTATQYIVSGDDEYWEIQLDLAFKSRFVGYAGMMLWDSQTEQYQILPSKIYPINRPIEGYLNHDYGDFHNGGIAIFSLEDILDTEKCYESQPFDGIPFDVLLNQDWFHTNTSEVPDLTPTLILGLEKVANIGGSIEVGRLVIKEVNI